MPELQERQLERKANIPEEDRTPDRDNAAEVIDEMWPAALSEIADEAGYSRQHIRNVISLYYVTVENEPDEHSQTPKSITIPDDVENQEDYLLGWIHSKKRA